MKGDDSIEWAGTSRAGSLSAQWIPRPSPDFARIGIRVDRNGKRAIAVFDGFRRDWRSIAAGAIWDARRKVRRK